MAYNQKSPYLPRESSSSRPPNPLSEENGSDAGGSTSRILDWLESLDPSGDPEDIAVPTSKLVAQYLERRNPDDLLRRRPLGSPNPLPAIDTTVSNSMGDVVSRRGMESPRPLNMNFPRGQARHLGVPGYMDSPRTPGYESPIREIQPSDFQRDPGRFYPPRTERQNLARRERDIVQLQIENSDYRDPFHHFVRHPLQQPLPPSRYHDCDCPAGATIPREDRERAFEGTPLEYVATVCPSHASAGVIQDRFSTSDGEADEHIGEGGRPRNPGIEARPIHPDSGMGHLIRPANVVVSENVVGALAVAMNEDLEPNVRGPQPVNHMTQPYNVQQWISEVSPVQSPEPLSPGGTIVRRPVSPQSTWSARHSREADSGDMVFPNESVSAQVERRLGQQGLQPPPRNPLRLLRILQVPNDELESVQLGSSTIQIPPRPHLAPVDSNQLNEGISTLSIGSGRNKPDDTHSRHASPEIQRPVARCRLPYQPGPSNPSRNPRDSPAQTVLSGSPVPLIRFSSPHERSYSLSPPRSLLIETAAPAPRKPPRKSRFIEHFSPIEEHMHVPPGPFEPLPLSTVQEEPAKEDDLELGALGAVYCEVARQQKKLDRITTLASAFMVTSIGFSTGIICLLALNLTFD